MKLCEKDALKTWRYLYAPEQVTEWQYRYSNRFSQWKEQAFSYMPQDLEERLNVEYMEEAQNPDTDMYRIPLGTAKQMLLDGDPVYRLFPGGPEKSRPLRRSRGSGMSITGSSPLPRRTWEHLTGWYAGKRIGSWEYARNRINHRNAALPRSDDFYDRLEVILIGG